MGFAFSGSNNQYIWQPVNSKSLLTFLKRASPPWGLISISPRSHWWQAKVLWLSLSSLDSKEKGLIVALYIFWGPEKGWPSGMILKGHEQKARGDKRKIPGRLGISWYLLFTKHVICINDADKFLLSNARAIHCNRLCWALKNKLWARVDVWTTSWTSGSRAT